MLKILWKSCKCLHFTTGMRLCAKVGLKLIDLDVKLTKFKATMRLKHSKEK